MPLRKGNNPVPPVPSREFDEEVLLRIHRTQRQRRQRFALLMILLTVALSLVTGLRFLSSRQNRRPVFPLPPSPSPSATVIHMTDHCYLPVTQGQSVYMLSTVPDTPPPRRI